MKDTDANLFMAFGIAVFFMLIGLGGCNYLTAKGVLHRSQAEQIRKEVKGK